MEKQEINMYWMYPDMLNLHGDRANILAFMRVANIMGLEVNVKRIDNYQDKINFDEAECIKIIENTNLPVTIPSYGEKYDLNETIKMVDKIEKNHDKKYLRLQVLDRMETLKEELEDMELIVKEDLQADDTNDAEIEKLNEKIKELENYK